MVVELNAAKEGANAKGAPAKGGPGAVAPKEGQAASGTVGDKGPPGAGVGL
jgi:hypothetical protein